MSEQAANNKCVPSGDLICQDNEQRLHSLEQDLIASAKGQKQRSRRHAVNLVQEPLQWAPKIPL